jgi:hypothetical protein
LLHLVGFDFTELPTLKMHGQTQITLQRVSQELDWNRIDICRVTKGAHIEHL